MSQIFVWTPPHAAEQGALDRNADRFRGALDAARSRHEEVFGRPFIARSLRVGNAWIGQLDTDTGITEWSPWLDENDRGVAWSGVCEEFLGRTESRAVVDEVCRTVLDRPAAAADWQGGFAVVAWDRSREEIAVLMSAAEPLPLWETRGPGGWAVGSRAKPLLGLVGREPELDEVQASLFLSIGYLAGEGSLFAGVDRVLARRKISIPKGKAPRSETYLSTAEFFDRADTRVRKVEDAIAKTGGRFAERVAKQLRHSPRPMLSLTGGRDSRSVAAALSQAGYSGPAQTGGSTDSADVRVASKVARILDFEHQKGGKGMDLLARMVGQPDRALAWTELTEGIETIRHALHFPQLFPDPDDVHGENHSDIHQTFNGLNPGLRAPDPGKWGRDGVLSSVDPGLHEAAPARERMAEVLGRLERETLEAGGDPEDLPEMFFWQNYTFLWGQSNVAAKFGLTWWWTPLLDGSLVQASWWLPREEKPPKAFVEGLASHLAPELNGEPYEKVIRLGRVEKYARKVRRRLAWLLGPSEDKVFGAGPERRANWEEFLFERPARVWPRLIGEERVRSVLDANPNANLLWSIATLELFAEAHLGASGAGDARPSEARTNGPVQHPQ